MAARTSAIALSILFSLAGCDRGPEPAPLEEGASQAPPAAQGSNPHAGAPANPHAGGAPTNPHAGGAPTNPHAGGGGSIDGPATAGGLTWDAPEPFERRPVSGQMRAAEYVVPEKEEGQSPALLKVFFFGPGQGGPVDDNIERWKDQFQSTEEAKIEKRKVDDIQVTYLDVSGTFQGMQMPGQAAPGVKQNQRMLAAIAEGPKGRVFFKLVGEQPVVDQADEAFDELLESLRPAG